MTMKLTVFLSEVSQLTFVLFLVLHPEIDGKPYEGDTRTKLSDPVSQEVTQSTIPNVKENQEIIFAMITNQSTDESYKHNPLATTTIKTKRTKSERLRRRKERNLKKAKKQKSRRKKTLKFSDVNQETVLERMTKDDSIYRRSEEISAHSGHKMIGTEIYYHPKSTTLGENNVLDHVKTEKYISNARETYSKILELESELLQEMLKSRDIQTTLTTHSSLLDRLNHTVTKHEKHYSNLQEQIKGIQRTLKSDEEYHHNIEYKLATVMLDISEMSHLLATADKRSLSKLEDKTIPVETSSHTFCKHAVNRTAYRDCEEVYHNGHTTSGVYYITPLYSPCPLPVYCDMNTPPGGWMVIQRRQNGLTDFTQDWEIYRHGFGDITKEFWLGNDNLFLLSNQGHYQLRVDLWDFYGSRVYADYTHFKVEGERDRYRLHVSNHTGTAPDSLGKHDGAYFSTPDHDNDQYPDYNCAKEWESGWWFSNCWFAILNGRYHNTTEVEYRGISWNDWKAEQLQKVEMKIRPSGY